jgi:uncharacterized protein (UPF0264 family)
MTPPDGLPRGLLVSVRSVEEAAAAVAGGAAIIDVKEPALGPLGAARPEVAAAIAAVAGVVPWTLACGELAAGADHVAAHVWQVHDAAGPRMPRPAAVKAGPAGLAAAAWERQFQQFVGGLPVGVEPVAVAYADHRRAGAAEPSEILRAAADAGAGIALVDTFDKAGPGIVPLVGLSGIRSWQRLAADLGLRLAVAGRLTIAEVAALAGSGAWVVGVRSAACGGLRSGQVEAGHVAKLVDTLSEATVRAGGARPGAHQP